MSLSVSYNTPKVSAEHRANMQLLRDTLSGIQHAGEKEVFNVSWWLSNARVVDVIHAISVKLGRPISDVPKYFETVAAYLTNAFGITGTAYHTGIAPVAYNKSSAMASSGGGLVAKKPKKVAVKRKIAAKRKHVPVIVVQHPDTSDDNEVEEDNDDEEEETVTELQKDSNSGSETPIPFEGSPTVDFCGKVSQRTWTIHKRRIARIQEAMLKKSSSSSSSPHLRDAKSAFLPWLFATTEHLKQVFDVCDELYGNINTRTGYIGSISKFCERSGVIPEDVVKLAKEKFYESRTEQRKFNQQQHNAKNDAPNGWPALVKLCMKLWKDPSIIPYIRIYAAYVSADYVADDSQPDGLAVVKYNGLLRSSDVYMTKVILPVEAEQGVSAIDIDPKNEHNILNLTTGKWIIRASTKKSKRVQPRIFTAKVFAERVAHIFQTQQNAGLYPYDHLLISHANKSMKSIPSHMFKDFFGSNVSDWRRQCAEYLVRRRFITGTDMQTLFYVMGIDDQFISTGPPPATAPATASLRTSSSSALQTSIEEEEVDDDDDDDDDTASQLLDDL